MGQIIAPPDYGNWTPVLGFAGGNGTLAITYATNGQVGWWDRYSRGVRIGFSIQTDAFTLGTATGLLQVTGHGFTNRSTAGEREANMIVFGGITKANFTALAAHIPHGASAINFLMCGSGQAPTALAHTDTLASPILLRGSIDIRIG